MKHYTLFLSALFVLIINSSLFAKDTTATIQCLNQQFHLTIAHKQLNLTEDALVDNTGGYVDIPHERHYIKLDQKAYQIKGVVTKDNKNETNIFNGTIDKPLATLIYKQTDRSSVKLIQKIELEENNSSQQAQNIITTNIVKLTFDKTNLAKEYQKCK